MVSVKFLEKVKCAYELLWLCKQTLKLGDFGTADSHVLPPVMTTAVLWVFYSCQIGQDKQMETFLHGGKYHSTEEM